MAEATIAALRAVIFDLDGVLTDTAECHYLAWQRLADEEGLAFDRTKNEALRGISRQDSLRLILGDRAVSEAEFNAWMTRKNSYYLEKVRAFTGADLLPGADRLIADARARGLQLAVGSSSRNAALVLDLLGIRALFDAVVDGNDVRESKPAPEVFLLAAERLGLPPDSCAVIEDAGSGVDAALTAGMLAVGIGPEDRVGHAHLRYDRTAEVDIDDIICAHDSESA